MVPVMRLSAVATVFALGIFTTAQPGAAPFSDWAVPTNLGPAVNTAFHDFGAAVSKDGLSLYFTSFRPDGFGSADIWVSQRHTRNDPWGPAENLGPIVNSGDADSVPALSRDGHWLFFNSTRPGGFGAQDVWASWRAHIHDDFGWGPPVNLGPGVNSAFIDALGSYLENDDGGAPLLFFTSNRLDVDFDMFVSQLGPDGQFGPATPIPELSDLPFVQRPSVRFDGLEILFHSGMFALGLSDVWVATRARATDPWSTPEKLGPTVNTTFADQQPYLAADRRTLFITSDRPGGFGGLDLYVTTRTLAPGPAQRAGSD